jgi:hypothetical protein
MQDHVDISKKLGYLEIGVISTIKTVPDFDPFENGSASILFDGGGAQLLRP